MVLEIYTGNNLPKKNDAEYALLQTQVDGVADYISNFIKNVLSENEVRLNESGMLHISRPPVCTKIVKVSHISIHFHQPLSPQLKLLQIR